MTRKWEAILSFHSCWMELHSPRLIHCISRVGSCICSFQTGPSFTLVLGNVFCWKGKSLAKSKYIHHCVFSKTINLSVFSLSFIVCREQYVALKQLCDCTQLVKDIHQWKRVSIYQKKKQIHNPVLLHTHYFAEQGKEGDFIQFSISPNVHSLFFYC